MNQSPKFAYFAVACDIDLEPNAFGVPVPGPDSRASCDMAMQCVKGSVNDSQTMAEWEDFVIVTSACEKPGMGISLADIMSRYMLRSRIPESCVVTLKAPMFNTAGEVMALVKYLKNTPSITKVVICVKYWHALRCQEYVLRFLEWEGLTERVSVEVEPCKSKATPAAIHREFWIATIKNMAVMAYIACSMHSEIACDQAFALTLTDTNGRTLRGAASFYKNRLVPKVAPKGDVWQARLHLTFYIQYLFTWVSLTQL